MTYYLKYLLLIIFSFNSLIYTQDNPIHQLWDDVYGDENVNADFGRSVSIVGNGKRIAVGARFDVHASTGNTRGTVNCFKSHYLGWTQIGDEIQANTYGSISQYKFGESVSVSDMVGDGMYIAIGANGTNNYTGSIQVNRQVNVDSDFGRIGNIILGDSSGDNFGASVSISSDGQRVAGGAPESDLNGENAGLVRIYEYTYVVGSGYYYLQIGSDILGENAGDKAGFPVSLSKDGTKVAVGSSNNDGNGENSGHVRVFEFNESNNEWEQLGEAIEGDAANDYSGQVSLNYNGTRVAIGATDNSDFLPYAGNVRIFDYVNESWVQVGETIYGEFAGDWLGYSVSLNPDGNRLAIGAAGNDANGENSGCVRVYDFIDGNWVKYDSDILGDNAYDLLGISVSISDNILDFETSYTSYVSRLVVGTQTEHAKVFAVPMHSVLSVQKNLIPSQYGLHQNYPNPFNPTTKISYDIPDASIVTLSIYDLMGKEIRTMINSEKTAGFKNIQWNATDNLGKSVPAGMYLYTIQAGEFRQTKKMVLLK